VTEQTPEEAARVMMDALGNDDTAAEDRGSSAVRMRSRHFTVRLWKEQTAGGSEYRGSVRDAMGGAFLGFRDWSDMCAFMVQRMEEDEGG
jgi:hypothetical protein